MRNEIVESSAAAAAAAVRAETLAMWEQAEALAGELAAATCNGMDSVMARWVAETDAIRNRPLMAWQVYQTPDDRPRRWYLAKRLPEAAVSEAEAIELRERGNLVVAPGDDETDLVRKLNQARRLRSGLSIEGARP